MQEQTASQVAKKCGLKSLQEVADLTGVSLQTLINWYKNKPNLFCIVILGCQSQAGSQRQSPFALLAQRNVS